jgi:hypothetical protein
MVIAAWEVLAFATLTDLCRKVNISNLQCRDEFVHIPERHFVFGVVAKDRRTTCKRLQFDILEKKHLPKVKGSEEIDLGQVHLAPKNAPMRDTQCLLARTNCCRREPATRQISKPLTALFSMPLQPKT